MHSGVFVPDNVPPSVHERGTRKTRKKRNKCAKFMIALDVFRDWQSELNLSYNWNDFISVQQGRVGKWSDL